MYDFFIKYEHPSQQVAPHHATGIEGARFEVFFQSIFYEERINS